MSNEIDFRIDNSIPYGEALALTCRNHPNLRWQTKNIDWIGARSIFFLGGVDEEGNKVRADDRMGIIHSIIGTKYVIDAQFAFQRWVDGFYFAVQDGMVWECPCSIRDLIILSDLKEV